MKKSLIGRKVSVFWPDEEDWFEGTIKAELKAAEGESKPEGTPGWSVIYDDGDTGWIPLKVDGNKHAKFVDEFGDTEDVYDEVEVEEEVEVEDGEGGGDDEADGHDVQKEEVLAKMRHYVTEHGTRLLDIFREFDTDGSGQLDIEELGKGLEKIGVEVDDKVVKHFKDELDTDGDGQVSFKELNVFIKKAKKYHSSGGLGAEAAHKGKAALGDKAAEKKSGGVKKASVSSAAAKKSPVAKAGRGAAGRGAAAAGRGRGAAAGRGLKAGRGVKAGTKGKKREEAVEEEEEEEEGGDGGDGVELSKVLEKRHVEALSNDDWRKRKAALDEVIKTVEKCGKKGTAILPSKLLNDVIKDIVPAINDKQMNIKPLACAAIGGLLSLVAADERIKFFKLVVKGLVGAFGDTKPQMREAAAEAMAKAVTTTLEGQPVPVVECIQATIGPIAGGKDGGLVKVPARPGLLAWAVEHFECLPTLATAPHGGDKGGKNKGSLTDLVVPLVDIMATDKKAETKSLATSLLHIIVAKKGISEKGVQREVGNVKASTVRAQLQVRVEQIFEGESGVGQRV